MTFAIQRSACRNYLDIELTPETDCMKVLDHIESLLDQSGALPTGDVFAIKLTGGSTEQQSRLVDLLEDSVDTGDLSMVFDAMGLFRQENGAHQVFEIVRLAHGGFMADYSVGQKILIRTSAQSTSH
jgi:hypothetical protein